ncbi:MAG: DNRLRE domain-containing protein, partial [Actinomycetota bacterium]|nr:DNRLRE domain-containing protein [Actinomycetota bacterium]
MRTLSYRKHSTTKRGIADRPAARSTAIATAVAAACLLAATGTVAASATTTAPLSTTGVTAAGDAYTVSSRPALNTGGALKVVAGTPTDGTKVGYTRFAAGPLPAESRSQLVVTVMSGTGGTLAVHATGGAWAEGTITARNAPAPGTLLGKATVPATSTPVKVRVDLGAYSRTDGVYNFALVRQGTAGGVIRLASSEAGATNAPRLKSVAPTTSTSPTSPSCSVSVKLVPSCGAWFGVGATPLYGESYDQAMVDFERTAQRPMDIAHYYTKGQDYLWPTKGMMARATEPGRNRILFLNWKPTGLTWRQVANGAADGYLTRVAAHIKATHPRPFFLSLNAEMEDEVDTTAGSGQTAADFRDFYRHVV